MCLANRRGWRVHLGLAAAAANAAPQGSTYDAQDDSGPTPGTQVHNDEADSIAKCSNILRLYKLRDAKSGNWTQAHEITTGLLSAKAQNWMMMNAWPRDASLARSTTSTACAAQLVHPGATCTHGPKGRNDDSQDPQDNAGGANPLRSRGSNSEASHGLGTLKSLIRSYKHQLATSTNQFQIGLHVTAAKSTASCVLKVHNIC